MKPASHHVTTCKGCRAPIVWALTSKNGRKQPVDAEPTDKGNLAVTQGADDVLYVRSLTKAHPEPRPSEWRAMPHHATCTDPPPRRSGGGGQRARTQVRPSPWQR